MTTFLLLFVAIQAGALIVLARQVKHLYGHVRDLWRDQGDLWNSEADTIKSLAEAWSNQADLWVAMTTVYQEYGVPHDPEEFARRVADAMATSMDPQSRQN